MGLDATVYSDANCEAAVHHERLGNIALIHHTRGCLARNVAIFQILLNRAVYNGIHGGDSIGVCDVPALRKELLHICAPDFDEATLHFASQMLALCDTSERTGNPIVF